MALLCLGASTLPGLPARLGPQFSLFPGVGGWRSPDGEEDMGERQAQAVGTRRELGDVNKSGVQGGPSGDGGKGQHDFPRLSHTLGFIKQQAETTRFPYFLPTELLIWGP